MKPDTRVLSIITPVMKDRDNVLKTYNSLSGVLGDQVELVVQDKKGLSGLREVISDPAVIILEEDDSGTSHANNMAVEHANGKYLAFWGAGETAAMPGFKKAIDYLVVNPVDILFNAIRISGTQVINVPHPQNVEKNMDCQTPGAMIAKELFFRCGKLDMKYAIANDYDMFVKLLKATSNYVVANDVVVDFPIDGQSSVARALEGYIECELIRMRRCKKHPIMAAIDLIGLCYSYLRQNARVGG